MLRIGILGCGNIASTLAATMLQMTDRIRIEAVASRDKAKAEEFASRFGVEKAYGSYDELYEDESVDLVYVATPHAFHHDQMMAALEHGKNILAEKAFCINAAEAEDVFRLAREKHLYVAEAIWTRYMPFRKTVKEILDSGAIGRPVLLTAHLGYPVMHKERIIRPELGGGALLDLGVYTINFALMNFGSGFTGISSSCIKSDTGVDLQDSITFSYPDGRMAQLLASACCANDRQGIINGDKGYIILDNINNPLKADVYSSDHILVDTLYAPHQITGFEYQVQACMEAINAGKVETDFMPHSESLRVMEIMDGLRREWGIVFPND